MIAVSALVGAGAVGLLGGAHCLAMCGGFVTAIARPASTPLLPARALAQRQLPYNLGRITTYVLLGMLGGGTGGALVDGAGWLPVQRGFYVLANLVLLMLAISLVTRREGFAWLQRAGGFVFRRLQPAFTPLLRRRGAVAHWTVGMLWGFLPCGMVYGVLAVALFAGDAWQGGAVMLAFGLGTLPNLVAAGWLLSRARGHLDNAYARWGAGVVMAAFAGIGIWRAFGTPAGLAGGPFCLT